MDNMLDETDPESNLVGDTLIHTDMNIEDRGIERNDFQLVANILVITSRGEWETMSLVQEDCMITKHSTLFKHPVCMY